MVGYAYDLGPRQSARVIEQAVRQRATVWAETIEQIQPRAFSGSLVSCNSEVILLHLASQGQASFKPLAGQYYQILISLGETRYLTVCDLLEVQTRTEGLTVIFNRPKTIQVMQRRRFHRHVPGQAFAVYISWQETHENEKAKVNATPALGKVRDLSMHGMSVQVQESLDNCLFIGDLVYIRFSLNVRDPEFFTSATVCHKEVRKEQSELIIGLQFVNTEQTSDFQTRLRTALTHDVFSKDSKKGT
ncbi:MAG: PilZ domain-containing protein [Phycisphaerae bacterium]